MLLSAQAHEHDALGGRSRSKLLEIILAFWVTKISATTLGETAGDLLSMTLKIGYAVSSVLLTFLLITIGYTSWQAQRSALQSA